MTEFKIGQTARTSKSFIKSDIQLFAKLSLDVNPTHLDGEYAKTTIFNNTWKGKYNKIIMGTNYLIRKATINDVDFIADVIIGAEKSMTNKLGLANFFELTEKKLKELIILMLEEEIDGCEFSISSFFVATYKNKPVAALGGWLEGYYDDMPSAILKANLIGFTFPKESLLKAKHRMKIIQDIQVDRDKGAYQLEYLFVNDDHRGKRLTNQLMKAHLDHAKELDPKVEKAQLSTFENNPIAISVHEKSGFRIVKRFESNNEEILDFIPFNVKLLMERTV